MNRDIKRPIMFGYSNCDLLSTRMSIQPKNLWPNVFLNTSWFTKGFQHYKVGLKLCVLVLDVSIRDI